MAELAAQPVTGDRRANDPADDETGACRIWTGIGGDMYDKSMRTDPTAATHRRGEILAAAYPTLGWQHSAARLG
jgi:hypothetical protein